MYGYKADMPFNVYTSKHPTDQHKFEFKAAQEPMCNSICLFATICQENGVTSHFFNDRYGNKFVLKKQITTIQRVPECNNT
jgi:hypothetical protein